METFDGVLRHTDEQLRRWSAQEAVLRPKKKPVSAQVYIFVCTSLEEGRRSDEVVSTWVFSFGARCPVATGATTNRAKLNWRP